MMLIICDKSPDKAVDYLIEHTNKNFVFKQLLELGQLISSVLRDISTIHLKANIDALLFKSVKQGEKLKQWISENPEFVCAYLDFLISWCFANVNLMEKTKNRFRIIYKYFYLYTQEKSKKNNIITAIFRYKRGMSVNMRVMLNCRLRWFASCIRSIFWSLRGLDRKRRSGDN